MLFSENSEGLLAVIFTRSSITKCVSATLRLFAIFSKTWLFCKKSGWSNFSEFYRTIFYWTSLDTFLEHNFLNTKTIAVKKQIISDRCSRIYFILIVPINISQHLYWYNFQMRILIIFMWVLNFLCRLVIVEKKEKNKINQTKTNQTKMEFHRNKTAISVQTREDNPHRYLTTQS